MSQIRPRWLATVLAAVLAAAQALALGGLAAGPLVVSAVTNAQTTAPGSTTQVGTVERAGTAKKGRAMPAARAAVPALLPVAPIRNVPETFFGTVVDDPYAISSYLRTPLLPPG